MPSTGCLHRDKNGVRCPLIAREGSNYCVKHKPISGSGPGQRRKMAMAKKMLKKK